MVTASSWNLPLRFGVFELDLNTGELRKSGRAVKLRPQAAKVLGVLASRPGQLVTRESLQEQLWGQETFVDFEHGINLCIREIRTALGDDAATPRYVETLPRQGYRFIAPIQDTTQEKTLGRYRLTGKIGAGGMGEVYHAQDLHLGREVAVKVLPPSVFQDENIRNRFRQEAKLLCRLNHANIATVYDFETRDGRDFLVMEYIRGITLSDKVAAGPLPEKDVLRLGLQLAEAIAAAHEQGITHRDLKPGNLRVTPDGWLKILDFGLARAIDVVSENTATQTTIGAPQVEGTLRYMAPEQLRGQAIDARTDIYAAGAVLYEMSTGQVPFEHKLTTAIVDAILHESPKPPRGINTAISPRLEDIIVKCLEKNPGDRYQSAKELAVDLRCASSLTGTIAIAQRKSLQIDMDSLRRARASTASAAASDQPKDLITGDSRHSGQLRKLLRSVVAVIAIVGMILAYFLTRPLPPPAVSNYIQISNDGHPKIVSFLGYAPLLTDGTRLYLSHDASGAFTLSEISVAGGETVQVQSPVPNTYVLDISPDHTQLLVLNFGDPGLDPHLWAMPVLGGASHRLEIVGHAGSWSPDGRRIAYANGKDLLLATSLGTESHKLVSLPGWPRWIRWSPDGSRLRLTVYDTTTNSKSLWEVSVDGTNLHPLLPGWNSPPAECCGNWTADGKYFVFQSTRNGRTQIWITPDKSALTRRMVSDPTLLTAGPLNYYSPVPSVDGKKLFVVGSQPRGELQRYDLKIRQFTSYLPGVSGEGLDFSRDGHCVAYVTYPEGSLWRSNLDGTQRTQLTFPPMRAFLPRWAPDGKRIAFVGTVPGQPSNIYLVSAEGGSPEQLTTGQLEKGDVGWSADSYQLVFGDMGFLSVSDNSVIQLLDLRTHQTSVLPGSKGLYSPRWSPDGRYIAAFSNPEKADYGSVQLFDFTTGKWTQLAKLQGGYGNPNWSRDSRYIYFDANSSFYRVRISDHKLEPLVSLKNLRRAGPDAWAGLAPDDSPLLLRDVGMEEIYALDWQVP